MMTLAGNPRLFLPSPDRAQRTSPPAPLYPAMQGMALWFSVMWPPCRVRAVPCLLLAGLAGMQGYASPLRSPGPSFPSAVIFPVVHPAQISRSHPPLRQPCASGCGFPCALCIPTLSPGFYGGTAPPGVAEYVNNGGKHHAICETCHSER
ncbi:Protein of uncharacterised function (DUF1472) [Escherichia coli]|uniref:Protein of uncharacterized function (DUF1472) n=1 Tax=Escherichia coli TaxID=562 RepID=A0A376ZYJ1_ECOLX|nr:Protein of uncharacterised function (DUF1472) [Escherichia coli]